MHPFSFYNKTPLAEIALWTQEHFLRQQPQFIVPFFKSHVTTTLLSFPLVASIIEKMNMSFPIFEGSKNKKLL